MAAILCDFFFLKILIDYPPESYKVFCFLEAVGFEGDVRKQEDAKRVVDSTFKHFGRLDILVNAAAGNFLVSAEDLSPNGFRTGYLLQLELYNNSRCMVVSFLCFLTGMVIKIPPIQIM